MGNKALFLASSPGHTTTTYMPPQGFMLVQQTDETLVRQVVAAGGAISELRAAIEAAPGGGNTITITLRVNGADSALTATFGAADTYKEDVTHSVSVAAGDLISFGITVSGTPVATNICASSVFAGSGDAISLGWSSFNSTNADGFLAGLGYPNDNYDGSRDNSEDMKVSAEGTITAFYVRANLAGVGAGESMAVSIVKNGSTEASSTVTFTNLSGDQAGNATGLSIAVAAGDTFAIFVDETGTASGCQFVAGIAFEPTTDNQCPFSFSSDSVPRTLDTDFSFAGYGSGDVAVAAEAKRKWPMPAISFKNLNADVAVAPGVGNSWDYDVRIDTGGGSANGSNHVDIDGASTSGSVSATDTFDAGDYFSLRIAPTSTPLDAGATRVWGIFEFPPPSAAITGTAAAGINESDVVAGAKTIIITLSNDTWVASGGTFDAIRQDIIDGLDSAQVEATGWNAEVRDNLAVTTVVRTSDTVVTITLSAQAAYNITATETITVTVPATAVSSAGPITGAPTFTVSAVGGVPIAAKSSYYHLTGGMR